MSDMLGAALAFAARWPIFPVNPSTKVPLISAADGGRGFHDATKDLAAIGSWWGRWPNALAAMPTGEITGVVALDIDVSDHVSGWDALEELGVSFAPETPMSHTPRGGTHCLFAHPGRFVKTIAGKLGRGLDIRGDGGSLILPAGPGRRWDPHYNLDTVPLAPMPEWMVIREPGPAPVGARPVGKLSRYGEAALDNAVSRILKACAGKQELTLNGEAFAIGQLAGGTVIPPGLAFGALLWAAHRMPSFDQHRPWRAADLERKVKSAFTDGLRKPRAVPNG